MRRPLLRTVAALCVLALLAGGCATTQYPPQVVARGELLLQYNGGFEMWSGGRRVARSLLYKGLSSHVRCVPTAYAEARRAERDGAGAVVLSALGGAFGVAGLGGLYGLYDQEHLWAWLGTGIAVAVVGTVMAGLGRKLRNSANGHAVDAMNHYNDSVGSLGATCDDLRYPPPQAAPPPGAQQAPPDPGALPAPPAIPDIR